MGAFDTLRADGVPCPACGERSWHACQTKFFAPDYHEQVDLRPGDRRRLAVDPAVIARAELWDDEWLRVGEHARDDRLALLLPDFELRTCACGAVLVPLAHLRLEPGWAIFERLALIDLRDPASLDAIDVADSGWWWRGPDGPYPREGFLALAHEPRAVRRRTLAEVIAPLVADLAELDPDPPWTWLVGPARCEACGLTRDVRMIFLITHPEGGALFGSAWRGGALRPGARIGPIPAELATARLRTYHYRLRAPAPDALTVMGPRHELGCRCGAGRASVCARFRRDAGDHLVLDEITWRVVRGADDLADVDWIQVRSLGYLARDDVDEAAAHRAILAELGLGER